MTLILLFLSLSNEKTHLTHILTLNKTTQNSSKYIPTHRLCTHFRARRLLPGHPVPRSERRGRSKRAASYSYRITVRVGLMHYKRQQQSLYRYYIMVIDVVFRVITELSR